MVYFVLCPDHFLPRTKFFVTGLLLNACVSPHGELSMKRYDISVLKREILSFL